MRKRLSINERDIVENQTIKPSVKADRSSGDLIGLKPFKEILAGEGEDCENFINYIEWLGLDRDPNLIVLSSMHHYFFDAEEMKHVKTVVNLIKLNHIKEIKDFLHSIFQILSPKCSLVGCFFDNKKQNIFNLKRNSEEPDPKKVSVAIDNGILSKIPLLNRLYSVIDSRTNKYLTQQNVTLLLEDHGFKVLDMTEINGLTYFHAKKILTTHNNI